MDRSIFPLFDCKHHMMLSEAQWAIKPKLLLYNYLNLLPDLPKYFQWLYITIVWIFKNPNGLATRVLLLRAIAVIAQHSQLTDSIILQTFKPSIILCAVILPCCQRQKTIIFRWPRNIIVWSRKMHKFMSLGLNFTFPMGKLPGRLVSLAQKITCLRKGFVTNQCKRLQWKRLSNKCSDDLELSHVATLTTAGAGKTMD